MYSRHLQLNRMSPPKSIVLNITKNIFKEHACIFIWFIISLYIITNFSQDNQKYFNPNIMVKGRPDAPERLQARPQIVRDKIEGKRYVPEKEYIHMISSYITADWSNIE